MNSFCGIVKEKGIDRLNSRLLGLVARRVIVRGLDVSSAVGVLVVLGGSGDFAGKLLEGLALGLGDEERSEDTEEHEEGEDLEDVVQPRRRVGGSGLSANTEGTNNDLSDDGTNLTRGGGETVGSGTVTSGEALSGDDEGGGVGAEVEEELAENVETKLAARANDIVTETEDAEEDGEESETHELDGLATNGINESDSNPVTGDGTSADNDQVTDSGVVVDLVHVLATGVTDGLEDNSVVERDTVEGNIEEEP
jgi:hypothetical protein